MTSINIIFSITHIAQFILSLCDPVTLYRIRKTCWIFKEQIDYHIPTRFKINPFLSDRFITKDKVMAFRTLQAMTQAIISGSQALQFFAELSYPESDMDLYISHRHAKRWASFLTKELHYVFAPQADQPHTWEDAIKRENWNMDLAYPVGTVLNFKAVYKGIARTIQLIMLDSGLACLDAILRFHSSTFQLSHFNQSI